jgi:hypothetical protein
LPNVTKIVLGTVIVWPKEEFSTEDNEGNEDFLNQKMKRLRWLRSILFKFRPPAPINLPAASGLEPFGNGERSLA